MGSVKSKKISLIITIALTLSVFVSLWVFNNYKPTSSEAKYARAENANPVITNDHYYIWLKEYKDGISKNAQSADFNSDGYTDGKDYVRWLNYIAS